MDTSSVAKFPFNCHIMSSYTAIKQVIPTGAFLIQHLHELRWTQNTIELDGSPMIPHDPGHCVRVVDVVIPDVQIGLCEQKGTDSVAPMLILVFLESNNRDDSPRFPEGLRSVTDLVSLARKQEIRGF